MVEYFEGMKIENKNVDFKHACITAMRSSKKKNYFQFPIVRLSPKALLPNLRLMQAARTSSIKDI